MNESVNLLSGGKENKTQTTLAVNKDIRKTL